MRKSKLKKDVINIAVVDDEFLARKRIMDLLKADERFNLFECKNGYEAIETISNNNVDIVFLDVQMPEVNGFDVIENLPDNKIPIIVFVTAYDKFALKAFEIHALDYLLKPFDDDRFYNSLEHAETQLHKSESGELRQTLQDFITDYNSKGMSNYLSRIIIKSGGRIYFVNCDDIVRIKAAGKYLEIRTDDNVHTIRNSMSEIEAKLDPDKFIRIHRSVIVNIDRIKEIQHWYKNEYIFFMDNSEKFTSGNTYRKNLDRLIQNI